MSNEIDFNGRLDWLDSICNLYSAGKEIYESIVRVLKENNGAEVIVSPANLGDTVFIATLAKAYKKAHGVKTLIIVAHKRQAEAVEWFEGVDATMGLEDFEMICLRHYFVISRNFYSNGARYGHIPCYIYPEVPGDFAHIPPGFGGASLIDVWKKRILDLPDDVELGNLVVPKGIRPGTDIGKYRDAVLIAPAAFTNKGIPESFWEKLVSAFVQKGIKVYCNSGGLDYDRIIKGSEELVLTTKELIIDAPLFKHVFAVRSGFTDLVCKTNARLTVLHLGGTTDKPLEVEYGTRRDDVRDLGRMDNIFPFVYCEDREDELIELMMGNVEV